jgi:nuclear pore complex protein Nup188
MAAESSKRSKLIDVYVSYIHRYVVCSHSRCRTYQQLHLLLSRFETNTTPEQIDEILQPRIDVLKNFREPFGKPNAESRKRVDNGSVRLRDGVYVQVEHADKDFIYAISARFNIDEVEALVLFRSFLYNEGNVLQELESNGDGAFVQQVVDAFSLFYHAERRCLARLLVPIFRAQEDEHSFFHPEAAKILPQIISNGPAFVQDVVAQYVEKTRAPLDEKSSNDPRLASRWAKENLRDQLVLLEVLFWAMWSFVPRQGPTVAKIYETAYETNLGSIQHNATLLLDDEGARLQQDCAAVWLLLMIEVLELETFSDNGNPEISGPPSTEGMYTSHPDSLERIHQLVTSHGDSNYAAVYLAWTSIVARLETAVSALEECPPAYRSFFQSLDIQNRQPFSKNREPVNTLMLQRVLDPSVGLLNLLLSLLTTTPLFVTSIAWKTDSSISEPNAVAYRSVIKGTRRCFIHSLGNLHSNVGLLIALSELIPVELIPDFDTFVDVWVALLGQSEPRSVIGLCQQFWQYDLTKSKARRAILDVPRSRFPVQFKPLLRLLGALTGCGFKDADPLSSVDHRQHDHSLMEARAQCAQEVSYFLENLPTYTQVLPASACTGSQALYDKVPERYGSSSKALGPTYTNLRPLKLPGGNILPPRSTGRLLSQDGEDFVIVSWQCEHSGWKLLVDILYDYVRRKRLIPGLPSPVTGAPMGNRTSSQTPVVLRLEDIGLELDPDGDSSVVAVALDLLRTVISDNQLLAAQVLNSLENGGGVQAATGAETPDLVQLTMLILEDALVRSARQHTGTSPESALITSAMGLLAGLLSIPGYAPRVWLFARASTVLFDSPRSRGTTAAERAVGSYATTQALLHLVHALWIEASGTLLAPHDSRARLIEIKEEVLLRALRFVHVEVWVEHVRWKYAQLGMRFEVGKLVSSLYADVLEQVPPDRQGPLSIVSQAVFEALVSKAMTSNIEPLISAVTSFGVVSHRIRASRRLSDLLGLHLVLQSHLRIMRFCLVFKQRMCADEGPCLLEQTLCSRASSNSGSFGGGRHKADPLDVLTGFVEDPTTDSTVPLESIRLLYSLCSSLSTSQFSAPSMVGHFSDPEATVAALVGVARHPYYDLDVRLGVWRFMALAVEKEPALGHLFVVGLFRAPKGEPTESKEKGKHVSALDASREMLANWNDYWESNPQLLASILGFLVAVWQRGREHQSTLTDIRKNPEFWNQLAGLTKEEIFPAPEYKSKELVDVAGYLRSTFHESISFHSYRVLSKAFAIRIIAFDIGLDLAPSASEQRPKPLSYSSIEGIFKSEEQFSNEVQDAISNAYDPTLYVNFSEKAEELFPDLALENYESEKLVGERELGDDFAFAGARLQLRTELSNVESTDTTVARTDELIHTLFSINLNLSLAYASTQLGQSWQALLVKVAPFLQGDIKFRLVVLSLASLISASIAKEKRSGEIILTAHGIRLAILLALLELAWFSGATFGDEKGEVASFMKVMENAHDIIVSEWQPPINSVRNTTRAPFHRTLLQIIYFCATECRGLSRRQQPFTAEYRLIASSTINASLLFVIDALRFVFDAARTRLDVDLDADMQLLVAVFEQCTRLDINPSTSHWLTKCQETSVLHSSMELFVQTDLSGLSILQHTRARKQALYAPHILTFHIAFASIQSSAERLASERVLVAYSNSSMTMAITSGKVDVALPELPGERSPAHWAYCAMLSVVSGVISSLGWQKHFFEAEMSGFIQLCGNQITRALSWTVGDPVTLPLVEEMERVVNFFYSIASSAPPEGHRNEATQKILSVFSTKALLLLQQLNYTLSHPNHLASLIDPVTTEERVQLERDSRVQPSQSIATEIIDPVSRPFLAKLMHRFYNLTSNIVCTLITISSAEDVLRGSQYLPPRSVLVVPVSVSVRP